MDAQNKENLEELVGKFLDSKNTGKYIEDIQAGEQLLRNYPAPKPDDMLISNIKAEITLNALPRRKANVFRNAMYRTVAAAAAVMIITFISIKSFEQPGPPPVDLTAQYATTFSWDNVDLDLEDIKIKVDQLKQRVQGTGQEYNTGMAVDELELIVATDSGFWGSYE